MLLSDAVSAVQACLLSSSQVDNQRHEATDRATRLRWLESMCSCTLSVRTTQIYER